MGFRTRVQLPPGPLKKCRKYGTFFCVAFRAAYAIEQIRLGRTEDEIMKNEFMFWKVLIGCAIPD